MRPDELLAERFACCKCKAQGGAVKRIATTGAGLSRLFDFQHNRFVAVSCRNCGYTEIYDAEVLTGRDNVGDIMDILFGH